MDTQISELNIFRNIPQRKLDETLDDIKKEFINENGYLDKDGIVLLDAFRGYFDANIPVDYWFRDMTDFKGDKSIINKYNDITKDIPNSYKTGVNLCLAGKHGCGKTYACACILKRVVESRKYSGLYVNLTDVIQHMLSNENKNEARDLLLNVDFLIIDEVDQRFMGTENASSLFGRILEPIMRTRIQNRLPLIFCTNSPNVVDSFDGQLKESFKSLMNMVTLLPIMPGKDFRNKK